MTLLHLSDTHGLHRQIGNLPLADVIVHSGDFCDKGIVEEVEDFVEWFAALPHKHKIFVAGNHDDCLYGATIEGLPNEVHYLCHSGIEIDGVYFYGSPMFVADELSGEYEKAISRIPSDTDVLITHQPPLWYTGLYGRSSLRQYLSARSGTQYQTAPPPFRTRSQSQRKSRSARYPIRKWKHRKWYEDYI